MIIENRKTALSYWVTVGAVMAAIGVAMGAFGAHGLQSFIDRIAETDPELAARRLDNWKTAAMYQMLHSIGLVLIGIAASRDKNVWFTIAGWTMTIGILVFSGLLYLLVLTEVRILGAIVPIGGVSMIVSWLALAVGAVQGPTETNSSGP
ncbi:MAG: DUF423 domain-containing protein [Planctomycetota bacterium]